MSAHIKPIGWIRRQDGLEYAPVMALYAMQPAPENGSKPVEMYSRDQVEHLLAALDSKDAEIAAQAARYSELFGAYHEACAEIAVLKAALRQKTVNELLNDTNGQLRLDVQEAWELASERAAERDALQQDATCYHWLQRATQTQVMQVFDLAETDVHLTRIILDAIARETGK